MNDATEPTNEERFIGYAKPLLANAIRELNDDSQADSHEAQIRSLGRAKFFAEQAIRNINRAILERAAWRDQDVLDAQAASDWGSPAPEVKP